MISINATLIVQIINLLVLLVIMNRIMYRPLRRMAEERRQKIAQGLSKADEVQDQALSLERNYKSELGDGRSQVREKLAGLQAETNSQAQAIVEEAMAKARAEQEAINARIEAQMAEARKSVKAEAEQVALSMANRILGRGVS